MSYFPFASFENKEKQQMMDQLCTMFPQFERSIVETVIHERKELSECTELLIEMCSELPPPKIVYKPPTPRKGAQSKRIRQKRKKVKTNLHGRIQHLGNKTIVWSEPIPLNTFNRFEALSSDNDHVEESPSQELDKMEVTATVDVDATIQIAQLKPLESCPVPLKNEAERGGEEEETTACIQQPQCEGKAQDSENSLGLFTSQDEPFVTLLPDVGSVKENGVSSFVHLETSMQSEPTTVTTVCTLPALSVVPSCVIEAEKALATVAAASMTRNVPTFDVSTSQSTSTPMSMSMSGSQFLLIKANNVISVKIYKGEEVRRIGVGKDDDDAFERVVRCAQKLSSSEDARPRYRDEENDLVTIHTTEEWAECVRVHETFLWALDLEKSVSSALPMIRLYL